MNNLKFQIDGSVRKELIIKMVLFVLFTLIASSFISFLLIEEARENKVHSIEAYELIEHLRNPNIDNHDVINRIILCKKIVNYDSDNIIFEYGPENLIITSDLHIGFKKDDLVYIMGGKNVIFIFFIYSFAMIIISLFLFYYWTVKLSAKSRLNVMMDNVGKEAALANKNMNILTENISHEAKTPLMVISSSIEDIKYQVDSILGNSCKNAFKCTGYDENPSLKQITKSFELLKMNVASIYTIIERIRDFKKVKYSNGNKTIYDIAHASRNIMHLYKKIKFEIVLDSGLSKYKLTKLKNEDLMNIFTNHIKNSVEAKSTSVIINAGELVDSILSIYVIDNGNGVPIDVQRNIFDANFSTKPTGDIRGVGLYLSKELLESVGGRVSLYETSLNGTVFEIKIPAKLKED